MRPQRTAGFADFRDLAAGHAQPPVGLDPEHAVRRYLQPSVGSLRPLFSLRHHGATSFVPTTSRISRFASASMDVSWGSVLAVRTQCIFRAIEKEFARINALDQGEWNDQRFFDKRIGRDPHDAGLAVNDVDRANHLPVGVVDLEPHRKRANDFRVVHAAGSAHAEAFSVRMMPAPSSVALPKAPSSAVKPIASGPGE